LDSAHDGETLVINNNKRGLASKQRDCTTKQIK